MEKFGKKKGESATRVFNIQYVKNGGGSRVSEVAIF